MTNMLMKRASQYLPTRAYFALNEREVAQLQREAGELRARIEARDRGWRDRANARARLTEVERRLQSARFAEKLRSGNEREQRAEIARGRETMTPRQQFMPTKAYWKSNDGGNK